MKKLVIQTSNKISEILIGEKLQNLQKYLPSEKIVIITDKNVKHHLQKDFLPYPVIEIGTGEKIKNLDTVRNIYKKLLDIGVDRSYFIVGIGGGVVCDISGFIASTYLRGISFGFVSSTLLAQVDASIGGKNGINFLEYKNLIGVINQPDFVICDLNLLNSLPETELLSGFAEIIKHAVIANKNMFTFLEKNYNKALEIDFKVLEKLIYDSLLIKIEIVNNDEKEKNERRKLNFGHTFGHAIEKITGLPHGHAISTGMIIASMFSVKKGLLSLEEANKIKMLLNNFVVPTNYESFNKDDIFDAILKDKKREGDIINFIMLNKIGNAVIEKISIKKLEEMLNDLC